MHEVIADLPLDDRPREKLCRHGSETLSDAELIALLLGSGTRTQNAIQLARELLSEGLAPLARSSVDSLSRIEGVGPAKATRIAAAFELARRMAGADAVSGALYDQEIVARSLISRYGHEPQEHLGIVLLDSRSRILRQSVVYVCTIARAIVSTRDVVRLALEANASAMVLFHNHPSGDPAPSAEDVAFTRRAQQSLALVDIELTDHLIAGAQRYCSMRGKGLL